MLAVMGMGMVFGLSEMAQAVPMNYTFTGNVSSIFGSDPGIANDQGLFVNSTVTYRFLVDFDANGTWRRNDVGGTVVTMVDNSDLDFFFTDYVSGDALVEVDGGFRNTDIWVAEFNFGQDRLTSTGGALTGNSSDDTLIIWSDSTDLSDWVVGTVVLGQNIPYDSTGAFSDLRTNLTLTEILPVPEPSTMLLLLSGLIGLIGYNYRRQKQAV